MNKQEIVKDIKAIFEKHHVEDYEYDGEDEYPVDRFDEDLAADEIAEYVLGKGIVADTNESLRIAKMLTEWSKPELAAEIERLKTEIKPIREDT